MEEPSQKIGDYALHRSEHDTGRVFSSVKHLGVDGGMQPGQEVGQCPLDHAVAATLRIGLFYYYVYNK